VKRVFTIVLITLLLPSGLAELSIHFLDVGQGDATLLLCDGESMLIDGGPPSASQFIFSYLRQHTDHLDYMIATHPHDDHVGGLAAALNAVPVDVILSPVETYKDSAFESVQRYADEQGAPIIIPYEGDEFDLGNALVTILHCWPDAWDENDMSICLRVDYGETSFLFTGDAEAMSEYMMLDSGMPLQADVLKVGHHGSRSSSTQEFVDAVRPRYSVISCGKDNSYGHPHQEVLDVLAGSTILRTDIQGTIVMHSDGESITFDVQDETRGEAINADKQDKSDTGTYIGNRKSMKFHYPECEGVKKMSPKNMVPLASREDAIALGYKPCGLCKP